MCKTVCYVQVHFACEQAKKKKTSCPGFILLRLSTEEDQIKLH